MPRHLIQSSNDPPPRQDPTFVQQGQVDWVSPSNTLVSMSVGTLKRLSGAGVQEITYVAALQLATRFKLADIGYRRIEEAVSKTQYAPAFANTAYFGFGYRSFVHFLAESMSGLKYIALCATLQEAHGEDVAARVMGSLWEAVGYPEEYQPAPAQFKCLVKACAGVLASSRFPEVLGVMLGPYRQIEKRGVYLKASDPADIAHVLYGLCEISKGVRTRMEVIGGAECSFIAAFAYWLFEFKVYVEDGRGQTLFTSASAPELAQVNIVYRNDGQLSSTVIAKSTFILRDQQKLLRYLPDSRLRQIRSRIPWNKCLTRTFGEDVQKLLELPTALGGFLGAIARIYQALAGSEDDVADLSRESYVDFTETAHGLGFAETIVQHLPELDTEALMRSLRRALSRSVEQARSTLEEAVLTFQRQCECLHCANDDSKRADELLPICLLTLAITVGELVSSVASVEFPPELLPTPTIKGLDYIYDTFSEAVVRLNGEPVATIARKQLLLAVSGPDDVEQLHNAQGRGAAASLMANAICLFTGYNPLKDDIIKNSSRTAIVENGICVYMDCLKSMSTRPELLRRVHIIPGHIERGNRIFDAIFDCAATPVPTLENVSFEKIDVERRSVIESRPTEMPTAEVLVDERSESGQQSARAVLPRLDIPRPDVHPAGCNNPTHPPQISNYTMPQEELRYPFTAQRLLHHIRLEPSLAGATQGGRQHLYLEPSQLGRGSSAGDGTSTPSLLWSGCEGPHLFTARRVHGVLRSNSAQSNRLQESRHYMQHPAHLVTALRAGRAVLSHNKSRTLFMLAWFTQIKNFLLSMESVSAL